MLTSNERIQLVTHNMKYLNIGELRALEDYAQHLRLQLQTANLEDLKRSA
jgi:hypothetical protein